MKTISECALLSEEELIKLLQKGDKSAFTEIYDRFHKPVYRYLLSMVKVDQYAEDLVHEIFLKLWEIREKLHIKAEFSSYLFRICHNKAVDATRKIAKDRLLKSELLRNYDELTTDQHHSLEELHRFDQLVEQAIDTLPPQRKRVYELCKRGGKSYREVGLELGIAPNTVKDHMAKALASLRLELQNKGGLPLIFILLGKIL